MVAAIVDGVESGGIATPAATGTWRASSTGSNATMACSGCCAKAAAGRPGEVEVRHDRLLPRTIDTDGITAAQVLPADLVWAADLLDDLLRRIGPPFDRLISSIPLSIGVLITWSTA